MRSLAGSLADGVIASAIVIPPRIKAVRKLKTQKPFTSIEKRRCRDD